MNIEQICHEALALLPEQRAELAEELLASLEDLSAAETELLWFQEAARRAGEMDAELVQRIPADSVRLEAQALLK